MSARAATSSPSAPTIARVATPPDPKTIAQHWRASGSYPPEVWIETLRPLVETKRSANIARGLLPWVGALAVALAVGAFLTGGRGTILGIVFVIVALAVFGWRIALRRPKAPPPLNDFVLPLLAILREEMARNEPVSLTFDLSGAKRSTKRRNERKWNIGRAKHTECHYVDPWLSGSARLADDARLSWQCTDFIRERERNRPNPRGKIKTKTKTKCRQQLTVRLGLPLERYSVDPGTAPAPTASAPRAHPRAAQSNATVAVRAGARRDVIVQRRTVSGQTLRSLSIATFVGLVEQAYGRATPKQGVER